MFNCLGTCKVSFIVSLPVYSLLSSPDYRIRLISPLDLGHFMVHLFLSSSPSLSLAIYKELCYLHVLHPQTGNSGRPNIEALSSLCKQNSFSALPESSFSFLGRSLTSVLRPLKLSKARVRHPGLPTAGDTFQTLSELFLHGPPTRMAM